MAMPKYPTQWPIWSSSTVSAIIARPVTHTTALARPCKTRPTTWSAICRESHMMTVAQAMATRPRRKGMRLEAWRSAYQPHMAEKIDVSRYGAPSLRRSRRKTYDSRLWLRLHKQQEERTPSTVLHESYDARSKLSRNMELLPEPSLTPTWLCSVNGITGTMMAKINWSWQPWVSHFHHFSYTALTANTT